MTSEMDELQVSTGSRILFITPTLKGVLDDFSQANPARSNRVLTRFSRIVEVSQVRFYTAIDLLSGEEDQFGYRRAEGEYVLTEDDAIVSGKTYYTKSGETYTLVSSPASGSLSTYYELVGAGAPINYMVVERSAVIKFDKHVAPRVFSPDELEALDSYMMKYRKYGIVELLDNKLDGACISRALSSGTCDGSWRARLLLRILPVRVPVYRARCGDEAIALDFFDCRRCFPKLAGNLAARAPRSSILSIWPSRAWACGSCGNERRGAWETYPARPVSTWARRATDSARASERGRRTPSTRRWLYKLRGNTVLGTQLCKAYEWSLDQQKQVL